MLRACDADFEGMSVQAIFDWDKALEKDCDNADYMLSKAVTMISANRKREALVILRRLETMGVSQQTLHEWIEKCK